MSMVIKRRQLVMATMVIALGAAVFVNWYFTKPNLQTEDGVQTGEVITTEKSEKTNLGDAELVNGTTTKSTTKAANDKTTTDKKSQEYFAQAKLNRSAAHDKSLDSLKSVITNSNSSKASVDSANVKLNQLADTIKKEADVENLIKAKLSGDCLVIINDSKAQVIVQKGTLNDNVIMQIKEIVMKQCDITADNITIIEAK